MKNLYYLFLLAGIVSCTPKPEKINYPMSKEADTIDVYFGNKVPDPYRWLEDDTSDETAEWVSAQNKVTQSFLTKIPYREDVEKRLTELWDYPKNSAPFKKGGNYYVFKNNGLQNQSVVYVKQSINSAEQIILDPNKLSDDGTVALSNFAPSKDGKYIAYGVSRGGSDWHEFYVKDIKSGNNLDDHILWANSHQYHGLKMAFSTHNTLNQMIMMHLQV